LSPEWWIEGSQASSLCSLWRYNNGKSYVGLKKYAPMLTTSPVIPSWAQNFLTLIQHFLTLSSALYVSQQRIWQLNHTWPSQRGSKKKTWSTKNNYHHDESIVAQLDKVLQSSHIMFTFKFSTLHYILLKRGFNP